MIKSPEIGVTLSFSGDFMQPKYPASGGVPGTLKITLANSFTSGVDQIGEVATITLQLANRAEPVVSSFELNSISVINANYYYSILGMGAIVTNVLLH
jgi:hypothetical protein